MNLNQFQNDEIDNNNIVDPNLMRKQQMNQASNAPTQKRVVTPQQMGYTHEEPKQVRPIDPILDSMDKAIARKQREAVLLSNAIEEADGEGVTEEEFQDLLVQAQTEINEDDGIPVETTEYKRPVQQEPVFAPDNNLSLQDELDAELEQDNAEYNETTQSEVGPQYELKDESFSFYHSDNTTLEATAAEEKHEPVNEKVKPHTLSESDYNPFKDFVSGDIDFDEENEELDENISAEDLANKERDKQIEKMKVLIREKIKPVSKSLDIKSFSISNRPAAVGINTPRAKQRIADWVLMNSQKPIYMSRFTGTDMERLAEGGKGRTRLNRALDSWQLIYNHIVDPDKPATLEDWAKSTSFLDIDHIYAAIYRANFEGSNYIPYTCTNKSCKDKAFLSDNFSIMDMCKFSNKEAKDKFNRILGSEPHFGHNAYSSEIVAISDEFAFAIREPSIYNVVFETAVLDEDFVEKFGDLVSICTYIDNIYYINESTSELQPIRINIYPNNIKKTVKSRIINFSKYISQLTPDQYNIIIAYINKINNSGDELTYIVPEATCPTCKTVVEEKQVTMQEMVFTRRQLAALANL